MVWFNYGSSIQPDNVLPCLLRVRPTNLEEMKYIEGYHAKVLCKDLGPQGGYITLFFFEYIGSVLLYPSFYFTNALPCKSEPEVNPAANRASGSFKFQLRV